MTLLCFAVFWIALQVLFVTLMLGLNMGTGEGADYGYDCLRDFERLRFALSSILRFIFETYTAIYLVLLTVKKYRPGAVSKFVVGLGLTVTVILGSIISNFVVETRLVKATEYAAPLIVAITNYEKESGHAPPTLQLLVPKYIAAIPHTGMGYPTEFGYDPSEKHRWYLLLPFVFNLSYRSHSLIYLADENYAQENHDQAVSDEPEQNDSSIEPPHLLKNWAFMDVPENSD